MATGEVAEWSIAPHSKCGIRATVSGVRIPPSPPYLFDIIILFLIFGYRPPERLRCQLGVLPSVFSRRKQAFGTPKAFTSRAAEAQRLRFPLGCFGVRGGRTLAG